MGLLVISDRAALLGTQVSFKVENHGDEKVIGMDVKLSGIKVSDDEINVLMIEPRACNVLYNECEGGKFIEPVFQGLEPFKRKDRVKDVEITFGMGSTTLKYIGCTMKDVRLECETGGDAVLSFGLRCLPPMKSEVLRLVERAGCEIRIAVHAPRFGEKPDEVPEEQGDLALSDDAAPKKPRKLGNGKQRKYCPPFAAPT
jgi:hypothetical protein